MCVVRSLNPRSFALSLPGLGLIIALTLCSGSRADEPAGKDGGDWPSFRQNLTQQGISASDLPASLELLWEVELGEQILTSCAIVGDRVYAPCLSGKLTCLDLKTGRILWAYQSVEVVEPNSFAPGFKSSPAVVGGTVYLGDEDGVFHAIDASTGKKRWIYKTNGEIFSSAAVVGDRVLFGSYDNALYCLKTSTGELLWKFETQGYVHCAPAVVEGSAFISGCDEHLRRIDLETGKAIGDLPLATYLIASPAIRGDYLYVGTYASEVVAVNWRAMEVAWRYKPTEKEFPYHSSAAVTEKAVVLGGRDKMVHAIDRETGKSLWTTPTRARVDSSPAIVGDRVFIGSDDGNLYELSLTEGSLRWKFNMGKSVQGGPVIGSGVLVIGSTSTDGRLCAFGKK